MPAGLVAIRRVSIASTLQLLSFSAAVSVGLPGCCPGLASLWLAPPSFDLVLLDGYHYTRINKDTQIETIHATTKPQNNATLSACRKHHTATQNHRADSRETPQRDVSDVIQDDG